MAAGGAPLCALILVAEGLADGDCASLHALAAKGASGLVACPARQHLVLSVLGLGLDAHLEPLKSPPAARDAQPPALVAAYPRPNARVEVVTDSDALLRELRARQNEPALARFAARAFDPAQPLPRDSAPLALVHVSDAKRAASVLEALPSPPPFVCAVALSHARPPPPKPSSALAPLQSFLVVDARRVRAAEESTLFVAAFCEFRPDDSRVDQARELSVAAATRDGALGVVHAAQLLREVAFKAGVLAKYGA